MCKISYTALAPSTVAAALGFFAPAACILIEYERSLLKAGFCPEFCSAPAVIVILALASSPEAFIAAATVIVASGVSVFISAAVSVIAAMIHTASVVSAA